MLTLRTPDDFHVHFRTGDMLKNVLPHTSHVFGRAVAMGNLPTPIATAEDVTRYKQEILDNAGNPDFKPIMSVMLLKKTTPEMVHEAFAAGARVLKLIPGNTSTNSDEGVSLEELERYYPVLEVAKKFEMIFSCHFERALDDDGQPIAEIDREAAAIPFLETLAHAMPELKICVEHATTKAMIQTVEKLGHNVAATLTVHHATITYDDVARPDGTIKDSFLYCKPIAKREDDVEAVIHAMTSGSPKFFFGSDSAPHPIENKQSDIPPAGIFTAPIILPKLCEIFEQENALEKLEDFVSKFGAEFYKLPLNLGHITLEKTEWTIPEMTGNVKNFLAGHPLSWKIVEKK